MESPKIDKIRYERLKLVTAKALESSIKGSLSMEQIKKCYPQIASTDEGLKDLETAKSQIVDFWYNNSMREFECIFKELNAEEKLNELDEIIQDAQRRKDMNEEVPVPFDLLTPSEIMDAFLADTKRSTLHNLQKIYNQLCADNTSFYAELESLAKESNETTDFLSKSLDSLSKNIDSLKQDSRNKNFRDLLALDMESHKQEF